MDSPHPSKPPSESSDNSRDFTKSAKLLGNKFVHLTEVNLVSMHQGLSCYKAMHIFKD